MRADFLTDPAAFNALYAAWGELQRSHGESLTTSPSLFKAWIETIGPNSVWRPMVATLRDDRGELRALCPLSIVHKKGFRILKGFANAIYFPAEILATDDTNAFLLALEIRKSRLYDLAWLEDVPDGSPLAHALAPLSSVPRRDNTYVSSLAFETEEAWLQGRSSKLKGNLRRALAKLEKTGPVELRISHAVPPGDVEAFIARKQAWAKETGRTEGYLGDPHAGDFLRNWAQNLAGEGSLLFATLTCGGTPIAWNFCSLRKKTIYCIAMAHNPAFAAFSPGSLIWMKTIGWGIANGYKKYDMLPHGGLQKESFASDMDDVADYRFVRTPKGKLLELALKARAAIRWMKSRMKSKKPL